MAQTKRLSRRALLAGLSSLAAAALIPLAGCGGGGDNGDDLIPRVATVRVAAGQSVAVGTTGTLAFTALDAAGNVVTPTGTPTFTLSSGDANLQLAPGSGAISGKAIGTATAIVSVNGVTSAPEIVNVTIGPVITTASGLQYQEERLGTGATPTAGQSVTVNYEGTLAANGVKFDSSYDRGQPATFQVGVGGLIAGFDEGISSLKVGGKRRLVIPPNLGYGSQPRPSIPANSTLVFVVELLGVN